MEEARGFLGRKEFIEKLSLRFQQYYEKESRFLLSERAAKELEEKLPFEYRDINARLKNEDPLIFWSHFITQYNFLSPHIAELLLKIAIKTKGVPFSQSEIL
jgi:hypothetical protein